MVSLIIGCTVTVMVEDVLEHPPIPETVYVIRDDPAAIPVTSPDEASIVATEVEADDQTPVPPSLLSVVLLPMQIPCVPEIVPAFGNALIIMSLVSVTSEQPPIPVTV